MSAYVSTGELPSLLIVDSDRAARRRSRGRRSSEIDRIIAELLAAGPDRGRTAARPQPPPRELHARHRAPGRLRRTLRHPRAEHDLRRRARRLPRSARSTRAPRPREVVRDGRRPLARGRRTTRSSCRPLPTLAAGQTTIDRKILPPLGRRRPRSHSRGAARHADQRPEVMLLERHAAPLVNVTLAVDAGYAADSATQAGAGVARARPARRRHDDARHVQHRRRARLPRRADHDRQLARPVVRASAGAAAQSRSRRSRSLPTSSCAQLVPAGHGGARQAAPARPDRAGKGQPDSAGAAGRPGAALRREHAYGKPLTGTGYEQTVSALTRDDL